VSFQAILLSIILAVVHAALEVSYLWIEAKVTKTSFMNYCIVCFNGRFDWVPYVDYLTSEEVAKSRQFISLDFEKIESEIFCMQTTIEF
jgi:hypothetical protein